MNIPFENSVCFVLLLSLTPLFFLYAILRARRRHLKNQISLSKGVTRIASHPAGNVSGWTLIEFLALPPHSEVSVMYHGPKDTQGFLELRKL